MEDWPDSLKDFMGIEASLSALFIQFSCNVASEVNIGLLYLPRTISFSMREADDAFNLPLMPATRESDLYQI